MAVRERTHKTFVTNVADGVFRYKYPGAYTATDLFATVLLPGGSVRGLGNLAALSISTHRDTFPVVAMPTVSARGFTQGHRMVAGTMIFHTIDRNAFSYGVNELHTHDNAMGRRAHLGPPHPDELPLFDIHITYVNEIGMASFEGVFGVRILDLGKTMSLENLHPMESYSYMAIRYAPMRAITQTQDAHRRFFTYRRSDREQKKVKIGDISSLFDPALDELLLVDR
jgi:hypothetical protein